MPDTVWQKWKRKTADSVCEFEGEKNIPDSFGQKWNRETADTVCQIRVLLPSLRREILTTQRALDARWEEKKSDA